MQWLILGSGLLVGMAFIVRWFASAPPRDVLRVAKWGGLAIGGAVVLAMIATGRIGLLWLAVMALLPWLSRLGILHRIFAGLKGGSRSPFGSRSAGQSSSVRTRYLAMVLDLDSGEMDGEVLQGRFAGRRLSSLDETALIALLRSIADDPQSTSVLEAYLDRAHGADWRDRATDGGDGRAGARGGSTGAMTREEALAILGLRADATDAEIKRSHRELMLKVHPDHGGSDYLAAKLNEAKEVLLGS